MQGETNDYSSALGSDDTYFHDYFPSSPSSQSTCTHRFTSPGPADDEVTQLKPLKANQLPLELIEYIFDLFLRCYPAFSCIKPFSMASSQFRTIALRKYMSALRIYSAAQLVSYESMHFSLVSRSKNQDKTGLEWISFGTDGRSTQKTRLTRILERHLAAHIMPHLTSLTLTKLWRIDISLLSMVAKAFPMLKTLHVSCSEHLDVSCCWVCFEDSSTAVIHSPIPNYFSSASKLSTEFAKALKPLTNLADLHLGIFLSDEEMVSTHLEHYDSPRTYERALCTTFARRGTPTLTGSIVSQSESPEIEQDEHVSYTVDEQDPDVEPCVHSGELPPFPHGPDLCPICSLLVSAPQVRTRELEASLALARKLKALETVSWSSFFSWRQSLPTDMKVGDWKRKTTTYVLREGGRVRVRRRPWDQYLDKHK
ncbi:hypothetical protein F5I97DRAFT_2022834 [Phlebopus sp. FC_14]|nr:hypothetical protein F5I97DRAFT_2022834 [Phlebopus sp. FC_14]